MKTPGLLNSIPDSILEKARIPLSDMVLFQEAERLGARFTALFDRQFVDTISLYVWIPKGKLLAVGDLIKKNISLDRNLTIYTGVDSYKQEVIYSGRIKMDTTGFTKYIHLTYLV